jgi:hypothetical protein
MSESRHHQAEYFEIHAERINYLTGLVGTALEHDSVFIEGSTQSEPEIVSGEPLAGSTDELLAGLAFNKLQTMASMVDTLRVFDEQKAEGKDDDQILEYINLTQPDLLDYKKGTYLTRTVVLDNGTDLTLTKAEIEGLATYETATEFVMQVRDAAVNHTVSITLLGEQVEQAIIDTKPESNPVMERAAIIMGANAYDKLRLPLTGRFEDEVELDALLTNIYRNYIGTSHEEEILPLLEEVRSQALSQKSFSALRQNLTMPVQDDYEEFISLIEAVV